jgi:glycosyltransferase involved in cell wall biosynthesis
MKKILFILNGITKNNGDVGVSGGDIRLFEIIKNITGFEKYILTTPNGKDLIKKFHISLKKTFEIKYSVTSGIISNLKISILSFMSLPKELNDFEGFVYSSCEHLYDVLPALRLKITNKCKWYAVYHWVEDYPWIEKRGNTPFLKRYVYWLNRWFSGQLIKYFADEILAVSDQTRNKLIKIKKINPKKIKAVYCGVEYERITKIIDKYQDEKGKQYDAIYMKRLNYGKGILDLLDIWKKVCLINKNAKLAIIGDGPKDVIDAINEFIIASNLTNNIFLLGIIYGMDEKFRLLNSSKIFILPSHEENWAIVIGEAMAAKIPVIAYSLKEIKPIWMDNVEWIRFGNIDEFSEKIIDYLNSELMRNKMSNKAHKFIVRYDWETIAVNEI